MDYQIEKIVIECPECRQKLRLPLFNERKLKIKCQRCNKEFDFDCKEYRKKQLVRQGLVWTCCTFLLITDLAFPFIVKAKFRKWSVVIEKNYDENLRKTDQQYSVELSDLRNSENREIQAIDTDDYRDILKRKSLDYYSKIWKARNEYDSRYAISPREKAQLEMFAISKDRTKTIEQIIRDVAIKAAPPNSTVNVSQVENGVRLDIDFDMSELTAGEEGSRTKHDTVSSLQKEVVKLISRVTNDVYRFCRDLDLKTIAIGCRHYVNSYSRDEYSSLLWPKSSYSEKVNQVLYKVRLDEEDIKELNANPFLDAYSTTQYFSIEHNEFPNLTISYEK